MHRCLGREEEIAAATSQADDAKKGDLYGAQHEGDSPGEGLGWLRTHLAESLSSESCQGETVVNILRALERWVGERVVGGGWGTHDNAYHGR